MTTTTYDSLNYAIKVRQGQTFTRAFTWKPDGTNAQNLTGYTARLQVRRVAGSTTYLAEWTSADSSGERLVLGGSAGTITFDLSATVTAALPAGRFVYDLEVESGSGVVTPLMAGPFIVEPGVTR